MGVESYIERSTLFKIRKVARYVRLYGPARTYVKVRNQLHMRESAAFDGDVWFRDGARGRHAAGRMVGIIGCGSFSFSTIAHYLRRRDPSFLKGAMDVDSARARSLVSRYRGSYATVNPSVILDDPDISLVYIASNHASHAEYAIDAILKGKNVHIEKPHVVDRHQLKRLSDAMRERPGVRVFLGFNRPRSILFQKLEAEMRQETGPSMINWFIAGHAIDDDHWYFKDEEGGRILGNLCHWSDMSLKMIPPLYRFPCKVVPTSPHGARSDFVTALEFSDGSLACITFSAKGHTFEGVREVLHLHKGELLGDIYDFQRLCITKLHEKRDYRLMFRDHGHAANILNSFDTIRKNAAQPECERQHVFDTARLFLAIRDAHRTGEPVIVQRDEYPR